MRTWLGLSLLILISSCSVWQSEVRELIESQGTGYTDQFKSSSLLCESALEDSMKLVSDASLMTEHTDEQGRSTLFYRNQESDYLLFFDKNISCVAKYTAGRFDTNEIETLHTEFYHN